MIHKKKYFEFWPYVLVAVLVTLVYLPTFSGDFILDDNSLIKNNIYVKTLHSPISYLAQEDGVTDECSDGDYHTGYYRPLINLTYSLDYGLWGFNAPGFRTTNLILHIFCCFVLFHFLQFLINDRYAALWATLIFALHPVNTEAVSWIGSRDNILAAFFSISSLLFYMKGWEGGSRLSRMASVLTFALAILSKEMGLMVLPLYFLYQRLLSRTRRNVTKELLSYLPFIIVALCYFLLRKAVTSSFSSPLQVVYFWKSVCLAPYVILWNLRLIFFPHGLHSFVVEYPPNYISWQAVAGFFYIGLLLLLIWRLRKNRIVVFSLLAFHLLIFPTLNIIPTSAISLVSMRWLYFPMAFMTLIFAQVIKGFLKTNRFIARGALCALLAYFGGYSYILNSSLWKNENNFFRQEVLNFGNYFYAGGFAESLYEKKEYEDAEICFQIAITHYPKKAMNYLNYCALLMDTGRSEAALTYLKKAKALGMSRSRWGQWYNNMGVAHFRLGRHDEAFKYFVKAATHCPRKIQYRANLGAAYTTKGDYERAASVLEKALEIAPDSVPLHKNLALNYIKMKRYRDAVRVLQDIPKEEWAKHGVQELFEKAQKGLLKSDGKPGEPQP